MLHHTVEWQKALAVAMRVLQQGGHLVGYDLLSTAPLRMLHRHDGDRLRLMSLRELRAVVDELPIDQAILRPSLAGFVVRFRCAVADANGPPRHCVCPGGPSELDRRI
jgi:hypothetical protein